MNVQRVLQFHEAWSTDDSVGFSCRGNVETTWVRGQIALEAALGADGGGFHLIVLNLDPNSADVRTLMRRITFLAPRATVAICNRQAACPPAAA